MKTLSCRLWAKVLAIILVFLCTGLFLLSAFGVFILAKENAYMDDGNELRKNMLDASAEYYRSYLYPFVESIAFYGENSFPAQAFNDIFSKERCNYFFTVTDETGKVILSNYTDKSTLRSYTYDMTFYPETIYTEDVEPNTESVMPASETITYYVTAGIRSPLTNTDRIYYADRYISLFIAWRYTLVVLVCILPMLIILLLVFLCCAAGRHLDEPKLRLNIVDKIPLELYIVIGILLLVLIGWGIYEITYIADIELIAFVVGAFPFSLALLMTLATRIKTKTLLKNTVVYRVFCLLKTIAKGLWHIVINIPLIWKTALIWSVYSITQAFIFLLFGDGEYVLLLGIEKALLTPLLFWIVIKMQSLRKAGKELAVGHIDYTVDTTYMPPFLKEHGEHLNHIGEGLQIAVNESMKSERMRIELITNVSHDIKTPLTSIINYVDLLKAKDITPTQTAEYLDILDRQAYRLKKLTNDLVEASKASTGHIQADIGTLNCVIMVQQALAEYAERFEQNHLETIVRTDDSLEIRADGRLLWRVLDNLLGNIAKYAKPDSRVYVSAHKADDCVEITFKNISDQPLDITPEELTERFVRGDRSRHTDGSGLGLSIAKSLTEIQGGTLELVIDGDLFKAIIRFPIAD